MKGTTIKRFPVFAFTCVLMAVIFVVLELIPAVSAWSTLAGEDKAQTKYITEFESVNPVEYYELENGGAYKDLELPKKVRAVVELPQDIRLSTFTEAQAPEQTDETLPIYEYSHTVDKLMLEAEDEASASEETSDVSSQEETTASEAGEVSSGITEEAASNGSTLNVTEEEAKALLNESYKTSYNPAKVYSFTDNAGETKYRVYGSIDKGEPQWYAVDKEGIVLGVVEELDANWDFSKLDSAQAGKYQVKVQLPENYVLNQGVEIAYMEFMVAQENSEPVDVPVTNDTLPDVLPVSYIRALRAQQPRVSTATFPITVVREGFPDDNSHSFPGGEITSAVLPSIDKYIFKEERAGDGSLTSNGARLVVTENGVATAYSNVSGLYNVQQANGSYKWYYNTVTP